ncbi:LysR family transcriptional regulator [Lactobacillus crispatus]|jgi:DNA-binding transcriptional ArsR family regulator|uniref:LysR family transcriptional regulator n=1 Tax=Lactobacillus crispatus TaxID=47770 RepID=UPI0018A8ADF3|nr:LysR family transcriptional regulator [Lactobacillus crispatus]MCH4004875.1 LysR family transcriptional regulator [Lactobacillus crispatus]MCI1335636.1 LysR family transcriptional regulator [Lactobacillus crispatus]MCI1364830.1 LysR family transcriptional regulator [Lactobacillus crispatus]MCI1493028.1 LysR family transcriptional regulator [Lactobacillus crispatus]MCI1525358.1 LysR family transcriptional regulator [Lactobacillus crispatus]
MIENYLLEELVAYAKYGTIAKTAEFLGLTQPAVTHSMKKLEEELGVKLFIRKPNKLYLSETGKYTARKAKKLINDNLDFTKKVKQFDKDQTTLAVGFNAPGPGIVLRSLHDKNIQIKNNLVENNFEKLLSEHQLTCVLINFPIEDRDITSTYLGTESMSVNLQSECKLNKNKELSFKKLKGKTILSPSPIGFWAKIYHDEIPNSKIIFQNKSTEYSEILQYSVLPFFTTNLTSLDSQWGNNLPNNRTVRPLSDEVAHQKFYAVYLKRNKNRVMPLIEKLQDQWSKYDQK